ncbi:MAG: hypothetical protein Tsb009_27860 [Planctomycetaceae bacterium]
MIRQLSIYGLVLLGVFVVPIPVLADIAQPDPVIPKDAGNAVPLIIQQDRRTRANRLLIPRKFLRNATGADNHALRTILAGIAMSLAAGSLVFVLMRRKNTASKIAMSVFCFAIGGLAATELTVAATSDSRSSIASSWSHIDHADQNVIIEVTDRGEYVNLVLGTYERRRRRGGQPKPERPPIRRKSAQSQPKAKSENRSEMK